MTPRHRQRAGVPARPSDKDIRILKRMVVRARQAARDPQAKALPFVIASEKANKALLPLGHRSADGCFVQLVRLGLGFLTAADRGGEARRIPGLADACEAVLNETGLSPAGDAHAVRQRKDIYG